MRRLAFLLPLAGLASCVHAPPPTPPQPPSLTQRLEELLAPIERGGDVVGALVVDASSGATLFAHREHTRSLPASTMKVATTAAALAVLGPDYRFHTRLSLQGTLAKQVFTGDLILEPSGDPSFGAFRFPETSKVCDQIAAAFQEKGIRRWNGSVHIAPGANIAADLGPGWAWDDGAYDFSAIPAGFVFRENAARLSVTREKDERCSPTLSWNFESPTGGYSAEVQEELLSWNEGLDCRRGRNRVFRCIWRHSPDVCPQSTSARLSFDDALVVFRNSLKHALKERGIQVSSRVSNRKTITTSDDDDSDDEATGTPELLIDIASPPLAALVRATNKESLNIYAERLGLEVARTVAGSPTYASLQTATNADHAARGIEPADLLQIDGSGLSRYNLATPAALVRILWTSLQSSYGPALYESLPVAGTDGTLARHVLSASAAGLVRAKTGTLTGQRAFAGVAERPGDPQHPRVVFALMLGNLARPTSTTNETFDRMAEILVAAPIR